jgi:hypothetical protein
MLVEKLNVDGAPVKGVAAACASQWLHQKHQEQVFVVVKKGGWVGGRAIGLRKRAEP